MTAKVLTLAVLAVLFTVWGIPVRAQGILPLPHAFYGSLTINGNPAPAGSEVKALGDNVKVGIQGNPIITTDVGVYGGPNILDPKLFVQGNISSGTPLRFYVNGVDTGQTAAFTSGSNTKLDLSVTISADTVVLSPPAPVLNLPAAPSLSPPPSPLPSAPTLTKTLSNWLVLGGIMAAMLVIILLIFSLARRRDQSINSLKEVDGIEITNKLKSSSKMKSRR